MYSKRGILLTHAYLSVRRCGRRGRVLDEQSVVDASSKVTRCVVALAGQKHARVMWVMGFLRRDVWIVSAFNTSIFSLWHSERSQSHRSDGKKVIPTSVQDTAENRKHLPPGSHCRNNVYIRDVHVLPIGNCSQDIM